MTKETFELLKEIAKDERRIGVHVETQQKFFAIEPFLFREMIKELEKVFSE